MSRRDDSVKEKASCNIDFWCAAFWTAGWMFTIGAIGIDKMGELAVLPWYVQAAIMVVMYVLWPLILGLKVSQ